MIRLFRKKTPRAWARALTCLALSAAGCAHVEPQDLRYLGEERPIETHRTQEVLFAHSDVRQPLPDEVKFAAQPRTVADRMQGGVIELTLADAIRVALENNDIVQTGAQTQIGNKAVFSNPTNAPSVYDQAIGDTGVLFGRRGVEAALADFDVQARSSMTWGRSRTFQNNQFFGQGVTNIAETGNWNASISKQFGFGGSLSLTHNWNYLGSNNPGLLYPSSYTGSIGINYRQPLLAAAGTEFTRIAGPVNPQFGAITGVSQGVVIARINSDIALADFEIAVRNSIRDIQFAYWDLYLAYRNYDTAVVAHRSAHQTWREAKIKLDVGTLKAADEAQALSQFYETRAAVESSLNNLYKAETGLRRLMGMQVNDQEILRPADDPFVAQVLPDWSTVLAEALTRRTELRRQKWNVKSLDLQHRAAQSLVKPRLDFVSGYSLNGFGDHLLDQDDNDGVTTLGLNSAYSTLTQGDHPSWNLGFEFSMPLGFRSAISQVHNLELRVAKARAVLATQEREVAHDVTTAIQDIVANYAAAQSNSRRLQAANRRVKLLDLEREAGTTTLDLVLRAQAAKARAESDYYARVVDYNKALINLELAKGSLLPGSGVQLAEGAWTAEAYNDALRRAQERTFAFDDPNLETLPTEFALSEPPPVEVAPVLRGESQVTESRQVPDDIPEPVAPGNASEETDDPPTDDNKTKPDKTEEVPELDVPEVKVPKDLASNYEPWSPIRSAKTEVAQTKPDSEKPRASIDLDEVQREFANKRPRVRN